MKKKIPLTIHIIIIMSELFKFKLFRKHKRYPLGNSAYALIIRKTNPTHYLLTKSVNIINAKI